MYGMYWLGGAVALALFVYLVVALVRAVAGLTQFVHRVAAREAFTPGDQTEAALIQAELDELRQDTASRAPDAEAAAAATARQQEETPTLVVVSASSDRETPSTSLLHQADNALYHAKAAGRNAVWVCERGVLRSAT